MFLAVIVPLAWGGGFLGRRGLCAHLKGVSWLLRLSWGRECLWAGWGLCCGVPLGCDAAVTAGLSSTDSVPPQELANKCCLENSRTLTLVLQVG